MQHVSFSTQGPLIEVDADTEAEGRLHRSSRLVIASAFAFAFTVAWAYWAELDQVSRGTGQIVASSKTQVIQAPDAGVIEELLVREGDAVSKGQVLAKLDSLRAEAAFQETESKRLSLKAQVSRLQAEVLQQPLRFDSELAAFPDLRFAQESLFNRRRQAIDQELSALKSTLALAEQELSLNEKLLKDNDISLVEVIRLKRQVADLNAQMVNRRNRYFQDSQAELTKLQDELAAITQSSIQRKTSLEYTSLVAPVAGIVKNVRLTTQGAVLRAGDELLTIVPSDEDLIIEAKVKPQEIAFIEVGMPTSVKIDTYDFTVYGTLSGEIIYISADTLQEDSKTGAESFYRVHVKTTGKQFSKSAGASLNLLPGMTATVEVKTGSTTVLDYLLKPVVKTVSGSLGER